jgi:hypothetical protein
MPRISSRARVDAALALDVTFQRIGVRFVHRCVPRYAAGPAPGAVSTAAPRPTLEKLTPHKIQWRGSAHLVVNRQPELEHGTFWYIGESPELPAVGLDNRSANG